MGDQARALRRLIDADQRFVAADCYSAATARVIEDVGFPAAYMGGAAVATMHYAIPDYGLLETAEMVDQVTRVAASVSIPLIVDGDQLGESVINVARGIRAYERAGVAGVHIEDEIVPKHADWDGGLQSVETMQARIAAAVGARTDPAFVVIARCDELLNRARLRSPLRGHGTFAETVRRGHAYAEAGADLFIAQAVTPEEAQALVRELRIPVGTFGLLPGVRLNVSTAWGVRAAIRTHRAWAKRLMEEGALPAEVFEDFERKDELLDAPRYRELVRSWVNRTRASGKVQPDGDA